MTTKITFQKLLEQQKLQIAHALPKHINADRMIRIALTCFRLNPKLGECDPTSVLAAVIQAAQLGLEPGLNGRSYLIPYGKTCQFIPGWRGLLDLASRSKRCIGWTGVIYDDQEFDYQSGDNPHLKINNQFSNHSDENRITHAYAIGRIDNHIYPIIEIWPIEKIMKHRDKYNKFGKSHYSFNHKEMYCRKVVLLQALKYFPSTPELDLAIALSYSAQNNTQTLTIEDAVNGTFFPSLEEDIINEHEGMKNASSFQELASIFDNLTIEEKKRYKSYYDVRHIEFQEN